MGSARLIPWMAGRGLPPSTDRTAGRIHSGVDLLDMDMTDRR